MSSLFARLDFLGFAAVNGVLDKVETSAIMTVPVAKERQRRLNESRTVVDRGISKAIALSRTLNNEQKARITRITTLDSVITTILSDDDPLNDAAAKPKMAQKLALEAEVAKVSTQLATQGNVKGTLEEALHMLDSQLEEIAERIRTLESTQEQTNAQEEASEALKAAKTVINSNVTGALDSGLRKAELRQTEAQVDLERQMESLRAATGKNDADLEVDAALAQFKANMKKPAGTTAAA